MRRTIFIVLGLLLTTWLARADEKLPVLKVGAVVYNHVTVTSVTDTEVSFTSDEGAVTTQLKNLAPSQQRHFKYDAEKADAAEKKARGIDPTSMAAALSPFDPAIDATNVQAVVDEAIRRVKIIVNQPVRKLARVPGMQVQVFGPGGWYHQGAGKPDFNQVDVRTTQQIHSEHPYVTSDQNPGLVFPGPETEFNLMTKYFYGDRSLPKKSTGCIGSLESARICCCHLRPTRRRLRRRRQTRNRRRNRQC